MARFGRLQVAFGLLFVLDGLLQLQPANLGGSLSQAVLANGMGQPGWIQAMVSWTASVLAVHPVAAGVGIAGLQITLGIAIVHRRTRKVGLYCSIVWALGVWSLGEAFGNLATGFAMLPSGGPGAALLYAVAGLMLLPSPRSEGPATDKVISSAGYGALGERGSAFAWAALWFGAAVMQAIPVETLGFKLSANFQMAAIGEPGVLSTLDRAEARFAGSHGPGLTAMLITLELVVAAAALVQGRWRERLLLVAFVALPVFWVVGENLGELLTGASSDVGAMPLYLLVAIALLPLRRGQAEHCKLPGPERGWRGSDWRATCPG